LSAQIPVEPGYFITSELPSEEAAELEELFYFNPNQWKIRQSVEAAIQKYGTPQITVSGGKIRILLEKLEGHQTLFLRHRGIEDRLIGTILFVREKEVLRVLFFAIKPEYTMGEAGEVNPLIMMLNALKEIGRRIVDVQAIVFTLDRKEVRLSIHHKP